MATQIEMLFDKANDSYNDLDLDTALSLFKKITTKDKKHHRSFRKIAEIENFNGNYEESIKNYEKSLDLYPDDANTWNDCGNVYFNLEDYKNALKCYKKALEIDDEHHWACYNIGLTAKRLGKDSNKSCEEARMWFERSIKICNNFVPALNELGYYYLNKDDFDNAEKYFVMAGDADTEYTQSYYNLSKLFKKKEDDNRAKLYLEKTIKLDPTHIEALNDLGIWYYQNDDYDTAMYYYCRALEEDDTCKYALHNIGLLFEMDGENKKALDIYNKLLKMYPDYKPSIERKKAIEKEKSHKLKDCVGLSEKDIDYKTYLPKAKGDDASRKIMELQRQKIILSLENSFINSTPANIMQSPRERDIDGLYCERFGRNLTKLAKNGKLFEVIGRDKEIRQTLEVLFKIRKNNPILTGKSGVGKTAVVEGLAQKIADGNVPEFFKNMEIVEINMGLLLSGTNLRGDFEKRLRRIIDEVREKGNIILFIDEAHSILGADEFDNNSMNAVNILKPVLARGELRCIAATTYEEYRRYFQKDAAFDRRFYPVNIPELPKDLTLDILNKLRPEMEKHYNITIQDECLKLIVDLAEEEIKNKVFPDKAIDIMEKSFSRCALDDKQEVDKMTIKNIVGEFIGVKFIETEEDNGKYLLNMENYLKNRVFGQDNAIDKISSHIRMSKQKLKLNPKQPDGVFLFAGPSGVGKTYLAKELASFLFGSEDKLITLNMSEFTEPHSVSKLIGSPPGYVGHDNISFFASKVMDNPSCVLLFDEIEKAHIDVTKLLLQIFDEGHIQDTKGRDIYFSNVVIIMTSNSIISNNNTGIGFDNKGVINAENELAKYFPVEFVNRIDDVVIFNDISKNTAKSILIDLIISKSVKIFTKKGISVDFDTSFTDHILEVGYNKKFGVRNLERVYEREIMSNISKFLYNNPDIKEMAVNYINNKVEITKSTKNNRGNDV